MADEFKKTSSAIFRIEEMKTNTGTETFEHNDYMYVFG